MNISWYSELIFKIIEKISFATISKYYLAWFAYQNFINSFMHTVAVACEALSTPFLKIANLCYKLHIRGANNMESFCCLSYFPSSRQNSFKSKRTRAQACCTVLLLSLKNPKQIYTTLKHVLSSEGCLSTGSIKFELNALAIMEITRTSCSLVVELWSGLRVFKIER